VHDISFLTPIHLGDIVLVRSQVVAAHTHSLVVGLDVLKEDPNSPSNEMQQAYVHVHQLID
jgi:acyl-CoA hydrolase